MKELEKIYDPGQVEDRLYKKWVDGRLFPYAARPAQAPPIPS